MVINLTNADLKTSTMNKFISHAIYASILCTYACIIACVRIY